MSIIIAFLLKLIVAFGVGALAALIMRVAYIALEFVMGKLREWIRQCGYTTVMASGKKIAEELSKQAREKKNVVDLDTLEGLLKGEGIVVGRIDESGKVVDDPQIIMGDEMDDRLKGILEQHDDCMLVTA